jgi:hypothetical protein
MHPLVACMYLDVCETCLRVTFKSVRAKAHKLGITAWLKHSLVYAAVVSVLMLLLMLLLLLLHTHHFKHNLVPLAAGSTIRRPIAGRIQANFKEE